MSGHVLIELDTHPPVLEVVEVPDVAPPDDLTFEVRSDEPDTVLAAFTDAAGQVWPASVIVVSETVKQVTFTSPDLARGQGVLTVVATDDVLNSTTYEQTVTVVRPRVYEVHTWEEGLYDMRLRMETAYEVVASHERAYVLIVGQELVYEVEATTEGVFDVTTRQAEGG